MKDTKGIQLIHALLMERARLAILATLATEGRAVDFNTMLEKTSLTRGNLSVHARKLEEASLIKINKRFLSNKPVTTYECTDKGRKELKLYLEQITKIIGSLT